MDRRILVYVVCVVSLFPLLAVACPSGEQYCSDRDGCVSVSQNCSDGDILTCINMTTPCYDNGTTYCVDVGNYTCGNISCAWNDTKYCPTKKDCIDMDEHCCTEKEEACVDVMKYQYFFSGSETVDSICDLLASDDGNFTTNYTELKYNNPIEMEMCYNGTYFCPLVLHCIPMNHSCDPGQVYGKNPDDVFENECGVNETFCSLYLHCIPSTEDCSYRALFDWYKAGNKSVDPFSRPCPENQTFCPLTFSCRDGCDPQDVLGNKSCNGTKGDICPESMSCGVNDTECKRKLSMGNFTNVTDPTASGWLETCKYRKLIKNVLWKKASECKPHAEKCKKDEKECDREKLCDILEEKMEYKNMSMNGSMWLDECDITVNVTAKMHECNLTMEHKNKSCDREKLCDILEEKMEHGNMNSSMWLEECNITVNASAKMHECNLTMEHKNKSCDREKLCDILEEKMEYGNMSMNGSMWLEECNITVNASAKMHECNLTMEHKNKSCDREKLCDILEEKMEYGNMNSSMWLEECNITVNASAKMHECNLTMEHKKNRSCEIDTLCKPLLENNYNRSKMNKTIHVEGCDVVFNETVIEACNISFHSCKIEELCPKYRDLAANHTKKSFPKMVEGCKVDWEDIEQCNITFENDSCEIHKLCHLLGDALERYKNGSSMNESVTVGNCSIDMDRKVWDICGNHSCELRELCKPLRKKVDKMHDKSWSIMNNTIEVEMCNITLNYTVLQECNITIKKNDSNCQINKLCKNIIENDYNSSMVNKTIHIEECDIKFDKRVLDACNITFEPSCKVEDLCPRYRVLAANHTIYSFPKYIGKCEVDMDDFEHCNVTLQELSDYYYKMFYNGFKISDGVEKTHVAIRDIGVGSDDGHWEYQNSGVWKRLGPVSSDRAIVLDSNIRLRFVANDTSWHGLATLMYNPVKSALTGSHVDVSDILHDPRYTLALLQYPSRPIANVTRFIGDTYTVGEDEETPGFMIDDKIDMNLSHIVMEKSMDGNMSEYFEHLHSKVVEDYNETVKCFKDFEPAIAIIQIGKSSEGTWEVNERKVSSATIAKPRVVAPHDLLRFVSAEHVHGNWSMKFVAVSYSNCSGSVKEEYFNAPAPLAHALKGVMMIQNTSKQVKELLESTLEEMASRGVTYSLANWNGVVDTLSGSTEDKNKVKDIASDAFDAVTLPNGKQLSGLPRSLDAKGSLVILNNPYVYTFKVHVTPTNDQPAVKTPRIFLPSIAYNITTTPNAGKLVKDLLTLAKAYDIDNDNLGIAIVQALNSSIGSWYYRSPLGAWNQVIIDNSEYTDSYSGSVSALVLTPDCSLKFEMHSDDILWNNLEASQNAKIVFLPWDGSDNRTSGWRSVTRPSEDTSAYGKKSVTAIVRRIGCDGRAGSKGKNDVCGICGGDGLSCIGCDGIRKSGAVFDDCGNCTGGTTNVSHNVMKDCAYECGLSFLDKCGTCQRKDNFVNFTDCTGTCYGQADINKCGNCAGGTSGRHVTYGEDACGTCSGDNSTCLDCARVPNGGKVRDFCDKCLLPSDSRYNSECVKLKRTVPNSGPSEGGIELIVRGAGLKTYSRVRCNVVNNYTNVRSEIPSSSFAENGGRVIQFTTPALNAGTYTILCIFDSEDVWHLVEETFLVYNKSDIIYTSISPEYTDIDDPVTAEIAGTGFVNTSDIACVSRDGRVFEAKFEASTRVLCSIPATKVSVRLSLGVSFSRGDRRLGDNDVNFTIYGNASNPISARFLNNLQGIVVKFDVPTKPKIASVDCSAFFPSGNVSLFGTNSKCVFRTPIEMVITVNGRPTIVPNVTIMFRLRSITQRNQMVTKEPAELYKDLVIGSPMIPVVPTAVLTGTSFLGICAKLKLDGGQSYGAGGRRLTFIWDVDWDDSIDRSGLTANDTADMNATRQYLNSFRDFQSKIEAVGNSMIVIGPRYKFTLRVRNFLGQTSDEASLVVQREDKTLPGLRLGSKKKKVKAALDITLQGKVELSSCLPAGYKPAVLFTWEIQAVGVDLGVTDKSRLTIKKGTLEGGKSYILTLTAAMESDITLATTATIELVVESSPLLAIIKGGGSLVVGEDDTFVLDGSRSTDPDSSSDAATYNWKCFDAKNIPCFEPVPSNPGRLRRMVIPSGTKATINVAQKLKTNNQYKFVLIFTKGSRKSEASVNVIVKSGAPPKVLIRPIFAVKVNPTDVLVLESLIVTKKTVNATWSCVQSEEYGFIDLEAQGVALTSLFRKFIKKSSQDKVVATTALVIAKNKLENGVTYKFQLTVAHSDSSSFADIEITTNAAPSQGTLEIEPVSGFFGNTTFTFSAAEGWDDDADDLPMTYQFGYYIRDSESGELREELLGTPGEENGLEVDLLPQGEAANNYSLKVFVKVSDIYGAVTTQEATVDVKPIPLDASAVNKLASAVDSDFDSGDLAKGAAKANAVAAALSLSNANDPNTTKAAKEFKNGVTDKVLGAVEGGGVQDKSGKDVVKGSLLQMTSGCKPDCDPVRVAQNLAKMEGGAQSSSKRRRRAVVVDYDSIEVKTGADVESILRISQNVINPEDYTNVTLVAKASFLSTVKAQEPSLCKGLATGGPYELAKSNITVMRAVKDALGLFANVDTKYMEVSTSTAPEYIEASVTYRLGETLETQYASWACTADDTCTGTCIATAQFKDDLLIQHDPAEKNITRLSDIASIRLYNPETLAEISVSGLASPAVLRFPIDHAEMYENYTKECRMWNGGAQEWQMSGCSGYTTINDSTIECSCTQLGYIAVFLGEEGVPTTAPPTTQMPTNATTSGPTEQPEESLVVEFAFAANYSQVISGNTTKTVFISHLRPFLAKLLNISQARITNINIRSGSIIVTFTVLPSNNTNDRSVNSTVLYLKQLVKTNSVNLTLPGSNETLRVDPSSFKIVVSPTTVPSQPDDDDDDDDGLSTGEIVIIVVVCVILVISLIVALAYYFLRVKPARAGKISPHSSHMQLNEQQPNNNEAGKNAGVTNDVIVTDEKAV